MSDTTRPQRLPYDRARERVATAQLTLGEMIALRRYQEFIFAPRPRTEADIIDRLDSMKVCTTCGWTVRMHEQDVRLQRHAQCCGTYTPRYAQGDSAA